MHKTLPVLLKNPEIILLGAGSVALHKARVLLDNNIDFKVIAKEASPAFAALGLDVAYKDIENADFAGFSIVVDATGDGAVGNILREVKSQRYLLVNRVDSPSECDFYFSSLLNYGSLKIAVSTDGSSPVLGQSVRDRIRQFLPSLTAVPEFLKRKAEERKLGIIDLPATRTEINTMLGQVYLLGCGPGDPELLTIQAYKYLQQADMVLYDHLISEPILELIPAQAQRCYVGKKKGRHSCSQEEINAQLVSYAREGLNVVRLKSGDPFVFGRGAEELEHLVLRGIHVKVIPGISSAVAGPALAGIPLTARAYAASFSVVSAHLAGNRFNSTWIPLLQQKNHTTVVLMGLSVAAKIRESALQSGVNPDMPIAIVANATRNNQQCVVATVAGLPEACKTVESPAIIIFGEVVRLHSVLTPQ